MKIFQDIFSGEQVLSDSFPIVMLFNDVVGEVQSKMVALKDADVDIGCGNAFGGTNEQQEGAGNGGSAPVPKVINLVDNFRYEETSFDKPGFSAYFKGYMKKLLDWMALNKKDRVDAFKVGGRDFFKWALANFDELSFYTGPSYDMDNLIVLSYYKTPEDEAPTFVYVMDGLKSYKV